MAGRRRIGWFIGLLAAMSMACTTAFAGEASGSLTVVPNQIQIGAFYNGSEVRISAETAPCDGAVMVLTGEDREVKLNRKGRVAVIWMNVARIDIGGLPEAYILAASGELDRICSKGTQAELGLGLESLRPRMRISSDQPLEGREFDQFLKLKIHNGAYRIGLEIERESVTPETDRISAVLPIPSGMPPGMYHIDLYCFKQGNLVEKHRQELRIEIVGLPQFMINLVYRHAAAHGLLAIVVAMVVGILMGVIFSSSPGKGH
jgi:uncharacterized protein (TIGR02186 family)